jgi:hypothetical protein
MVMVMVMVMVNANANRNLNENENEKNLLCFFSKNKGFFLINHLHYFYEEEIDF